MARRVSYLKRINGFGYGKSHAKIKFRFLFGNVSTIGSPPDRILFITKAISGRNAQNATKLKHVI